MTHLTLGAKLTPQMWLKSRISTTKSYILSEIAGKAHYSSQLPAPVERFGLRPRTYIHISRSPKPVL